ncbi:hypothetical protein J4437_06550 [Candidatus Woesearchaeota archaeon]|nr:hypothetical protein [Candidatus Woesearchaeota archaeon]
MTILENSKKAINGLTKLIIQEPRLIPELKVIISALKSYDVLSKEAKDEEYFQEELKIINQAEKIANKSLWYGFHICIEDRFMLYKRTDNKMVPLEKDFENGLSSNIISVDDLEEIIKNRKIKNLITYNPIDLDSIYSQEYEDAPGEFQHKHEEIETSVLNLLKEKEVKITKYTEEQVREFERNLKSVVDY